MCSWYYYSLYITLAKIPGNGIFWDLIIDIVGIMSFVYSTILFLLCNVFAICIGAEPFNSFIFYFCILIAFVLLYVLEHYYKKRETIILKDKRKESLIKRTCIVILCDAITLFFMSMWIFGLFEQITQGLYELLLINGQNY